MESRIDVLERLCDAVANQDWGAIRGMFVPDAVLVEGGMRALDAGASVRFAGIDEIIGFFQDETSRDDGFQIEAVDFMEDGDRVAMFWESKREHEGKADIGRGVDVFRFRGDRICSGRVYLDLAPEL